MPTSNSDDQPVSSLKMQDLIEDRDRFRHDDIELLKTGQFSDAQIIVGHRVWNVHKSIVCPRSVYFRVSLQGSTQSVKIWNHAGEQVELLLEFIYSGRIKGIDELLPVDCVQLSILGEYFLVNGMVSYATKALWHKLTTSLQAISAMDARRNTRSTGNTIKFDMRKLEFKTEFNEAVYKAYSGSSMTCQLILADVVWVARGWLLHDPNIENLNSIYPLFGSHVLITLIKGPQTSFLQADAQLQSAPKNPARTFGTSSALAQVEPPSGAMQLAEIL